MRQLTIKSPWLQRAIVIHLLLACIWTKAYGASSPQRYVVIIANNKSLDEGVAPLSYAIHDGVKYYEMFQAAGAQVALLADMNGQMQKRFPRVAEEAAAPTWKHVQLAINVLFSQIERDKRAGRETHFYFIYSGHGGIGPNREGYVNLADTRLSRSFLYREIIARSPATFNHLILDACQAYYLVQKRGAQLDREGNYRAAVRDFLTSEELTSYPNTGVILAASSESETHEWSRWEAGIFSHELRSGMLGAADADGDGRVSYAEAAAFVESANAAIDVPRARLRVYYRPPAMHSNFPLIDLHALQKTPVLEVPKEYAEQYHVEDSRGLRVADFHPSRDQITKLWLVGQEPFFLRTVQREAIIETRSRVSVAELSFANFTESAKGSIEQSFRRNLFRVPYGADFLHGYLISQGSDEPSTGELTKKPNHAYASWGWGTLAGAAALGIGSAVTYGLASHAHSDYEKATTSSQAKELRAKAQNRLNLSRVLAGAALGAAIAGGVLLYLDSRDSTKSTPISVTLAPADGGMTIGAVGTW